MIGISSPGSFLKSIKLIYFVQLITGTSRCTIRGRSVYTRGVLQKIWSTIWFFTSLYFFYETYTRTFDSRKNLVGDFTIWCFRFSLTISIYFIQLINLTVTSKHGVDLFNMCQNLDTFGWNIRRWVIDRLDLAILGLFVSFCQKLITTALVGPKYYSDGYFNIINCFAFEIDILLWTKTCSYLRLSFQNINDSLKKSMHVHAKGLIRKYSKLNSITIAVERTLFSFGLLTKTYKCLLFTFYTNFFIWSMSCIKTVFTTLKDKQTLPERYLSISLKVSEKMVLLFLISANAELFKKEVENAQTLCLGILDFHQNDPVSKCAKKILWLLQELPPNFTIYGLLQLDSKLPFRFLSLIFVYAVVVLQFIVM